jgi:acyl-CoA synthetase (AMP-forming)/AMP-acid ligase II
MAGAEIDAVVVDGPAPQFSDLPLCITCTPNIVPGVESLPASARTEWVLLTSGTTGVPKMVAHSLAGLTTAIVPAKRSDPVAWATFYDIRRYGGLQIFLRAVLGGASLILSSAGEPVAEHLSRLGRHGVTHLSGTPSHWRRALMSPDIGKIAPRYVRLSGEIAGELARKRPQRRRDQDRRRLAAHPFTRYGVALCRRGEHRGTARQRRLCR